MSWPLVALSSIAEVVTGNTPSKSEESYFGGEIPFVTPAELDAGYVKSAKQTLTDSGAKVSRLIPENSVMVCCIGSLGKVGISSVPVVTNQQINSLVVDEAVASPLYVYYFCKTLKNVLVDMAPKTTVSIVNKTKFSALKIPLPPLETQKQIATVLEKADQLRKDCQQMEQELNSLAQSVFIDMFGDQGETDPLSKHIKFITSGSRGWAKYYSDSGPRFIRSLDVQMNHIGDKSPAYVTPPAGKETERTKVKAGDVLLTITGSRIGRVSSVPSGFGDAHISQHVSIIRLKETLLPEFLSFYMSLEGLGQRQIAKSQYGQTKPGLKLDHIKEFTVPRLDISEQKVFVDYMSKLETVLSDNKKQHMELGANFDSMMQKAFKGELNLKPSKTKAA